jgi:flagellar basal body-associated protein FliL
MDERGIALPIILVLINTVAILAALGTFVYTRVLYERPAITEASERQRVASDSSIALAGQRGQVEVSEMTFNISPLRDRETQIIQRMQYASLSFSIELRDRAFEEKFSGIQPLFMDRLVALMADKEFEKLTTVQGRYLLRTELVELINQLAKRPIATDLYFTEFVIR